MAYIKNQNRPGIRDKEYPSSFAKLRPFLDTHPRCVDEPMQNETTHPEGGESMVERFNRQLRAGHGERNAGDE